MLGIALLQTAHHLGRWKVVASLFISEDEGDEDDGPTLQDSLTLMERMRLSMQLSSRGPEQRGCTFSTALLSHVHFKHWKAECICPWCSRVVGFATAATTSWEQSHPLDLSCCTWDQRTQKDSSRRTETSKYLIFIPLETHGVQRASKLSSISSFSMHMQQQHPFTD